MPATRRRLESWAKIIAGAVLALTIAVLLFGWGLGVEWLRRMGSATSSMVPGTATTLAVIAAAQLIQLKSHSPRHLLIARSLCVGAILYTLVAAIKISAAYLAAPPGAGDRMALATSVGLTLAALATIAVGSRGRRADILTSTVGALGLILTMSGIGTYFLDPAAYETTLAFTGMAPHSVGSILMLLIAALLSRPDFRLARALFGTGVGSRNARRMLPLALLGPLLLAELAIQIDDYGLLNRSVWSTTIAAILAIISVVSVLRIANFQNWAELRRQAEERQLRAAIDGIDSAVFVFEDTGNRLRLSNEGAERLCGRDRPPSEWLFTARFHTLGERRVLSHSEAPAHSLLFGGHKDDIYAGWLDPDGAEHALHFSLKRRPDSDLTILSVVDETQGWILRENLARTERLDAVGQMAGGISHEMANIFGVIQLSADTALMSEKAEVHTRHLSAIQSACGRGANLTERLLDLSRNWPADAEILDLYALLEKIEPVIRATLPPTIRFDIVRANSDALTVRAAPADLQAALINLVLNSRNAIAESTSKEGEIKLLCEIDDTIKISVIDDGPGMPSAVLSRARDPFYTTRLERGGSGLGLAMVENFSRRANGSLDIVSVPGEGTTVTLSFPVPTEKPIPAIPETLVPGMLGGLRFLVVEDDPNMISMLSELLSLLGGEVTRAESGEIAQKFLAKEDSYDLLLTDIKLPGKLDGYALAEAARNAFPDLPVLYLTGYTDYLSRDDRVVQGLVLIKPVGATELTNSIFLSLKRHVEESQAS